MTLPEPAASAPRDWWDAPWLLAALLVAATVLAYLPAFDAGFIWDDDDYVLQNPLLREPGGLWRIWFEPISLPQYYPLVHTTFWLEFRCWDAAPAGYHAVNVALHAANAVLVWRVLLQLRVPGAFFAAALFALHPVHVESVAWITERKNVLSGLCYLLSLRAWLHWTDAAASEVPRPWALGRSFAWFVAALLAKTVTCSLPAVFLLIAWWRHGRLSRRQVLAALPFFGVGLALALVTARLEQSHVGAEGAEFAFTSAERVLIAGRAPWSYLATLVWPVGLSFNYERWRLDAGSAGQWLFPAATVGVVALLFALRHRLGRGPLVAVLFFGGSLVPALGFFDVFPMRFSFVADHYQYLASLGPLSLLAGVAARWRTRAGFAAGIALAALLGVLTFHQARVYHDLETLWQDTLRKNPDSWLARTNLASLQVQRGEHAAAIAGLERSLWLFEAPETRLALGIARFATGDAAGARRELERALDLAPHRSDAKAHLGQTLHALGEHERAVAVLQESLAMREDYDRARAFLGAVLHAQGRHRDALPHLLRALQLNPLAVDALGTLARVQLALGDHDQALVCAANLLFHEPHAAATREVALAVLPPVLAAMTPQRAAEVAGELRSKVPIVAELAGPLLAALARTPVIADAVRKPLTAQ